MWNLCGQITAGHSKVHNLGLINQPDYWLTNSVGYSSKHCLFTNAPNCALYYQKTEKQKGPLLCFHKLPKAFCLQEDS